MLLTSSGQMVGAISGGCLENDIFEHTQQRMESGEPIVVTYDTNADEDIVWGMGLGCNGVVQVLIDRLEKSHINPLAFLDRCFDRQQQGAIATVFSVEAANVKVGARLVLDANGSVNTDIAHPDLSAAIATDAQIVLHRQQSTINKYQLPVGTVKVLIEYIQPPTHSIVFGAGRDAVPVAQFAKALGWNVTVVDCRSHPATPERFAIADQIVFTRREHLAQHVCLKPHSVAVVMTHNYLDDLEILKMLLPLPLSYLGVLGSKQRTERLLQDVLLAGVTPTQTQLQKLSAPIGIDIGADTPEAIAIAIIAEIQAVIANRAGGFLKHRHGSIHQHHKIEEIPLMRTQQAIAFNHHSFLTSDF
jgi:xanthine/CO dehydrogenase XdhC/CoxF family maturation factor